MGGARDKVKAYASTYPNIGVPRVYAEHALACKDEGYLAYKIHPHYFWNPETGQPTPGRPSNIKADIETIHLVREAVGPDYVLMYDPWGTYMSMEEAIKVGRELEKLDYYWYEHPMPEYRVESYVRLCRELSIPILSPEIVAGGVFSRAEWILRGAGDMSRIDVVRGGITGARKTAIVCEAYGLRCEMHMAGWGNLQVCGATSEDTSEYYEKGLLAPGVDYDAPHPYLKDTCDKIDADGYVHLPTGPGMGYEIEWDYIDDNLIDPSLAKRSSGRVGQQACRASSARSRLSTSWPARVRSACAPLRSSSSCRSARCTGCCSTSPRRASSSATPDGDWELSFRLLEITGLQLDRIALPALGAALLPSGSRRRRARR